ncbi:MAG: hypothetical protein LBQ38_03615 [Spirochaetaceae bacterium]|jgi:hypothetical protein|nr:hypothetical protein [Spirochaetaceae bacterium]
MKIIRDFSFLPIAPVCLLLGLTIPLFGAEIRVPRFEAASRGASQEGEFIVSSKVAADIALDGGYKFSALLGFSLEARNLEKAMTYRNFGFAPMPGMAAWTPQPSATPADIQNIEDRLSELEKEHLELVDEYNELVNSHNALMDRMNNQAVLSFRIARAVVRDVFKLPLELTYFIGVSDVFCSGDEFASRFGTDPIGSDYRGFFYFPEGIGGDSTRQYNGIHGVRGTGVSLALTPWHFLAPLVYLYEDFSFIDSRTGLAELGHYSGDLRLLVNLKPVKLEGFAGTTLAKDQGPIFRGGILAHFDSGKGANFLLQCGIPGWQQGEAFSIDNLYFLMEPRIHFRVLGLALTFFYHPLQYLQVETPDERGKADINLKFSAGDLATTGIAGGLETTIRFKSENMEEFSLFISPFIGFITGELRWDAKIRIKPLVFDRPGEVLELFMGIQSSF